MSVRLAIIVIGPLLLVGPGYSLVGSASHLATSGTRQALEDRAEQKRNEKWAAEAWQAVRGSDSGRLPAYENDVLHALTRTGGLPGLDAYNQIVIQRGCFRDGRERPGLLGELGAVSSDRNPSTCLGRGGLVIRIPLRLPPGQALCLQPQDIILQTGDVVFLEARDDAYFYTGGLLPAGAHLLPRDRDLDALEAIAMVRGPLINGAFGGSNLSGNLIAPGIGNPSPTLLTVVRRTPGGGQVPIAVDLRRALRDPAERVLLKPGDLLILQEKPEEAMTRYFTQTFLNFNLAWQVIHERFATGVIDVSAPDRLPNRLLQINSAP